MTESDFYDLSPFEKIQLIEEWVLHSLGDCRTGNYTTEIDGAWLIMEKAIAEGAKPLVNYAHNYTDHHWPASWHCSIDTTQGLMDEESPIFHGHAETAPMAICLAALRWRGVIE